VSVAGISLGSVTEGDQAHTSGPLAQWACQRAAVTASGEGGTAGAEYMLEALCSACNHMLPYVY
jgi:hypothetical protein